MLQELKAWGAIPFAVACLQAAFATNAAADPEAEAPPQYEERTIETYVVDPVTGERKKQLKTVRVRVEEKVDPVEPPPSVVVVPPYEGAPTAPPFPPTAPPLPPPAVKPPLDVEPHEAMLADLRDLMASQARIGQYPSNNPVLAELARLIESFAPAPLPKVFIRNEGPANLVVSAAGKRYVLRPSSRRYAIEIPEGKSSISLGRGGNKAKVQIRHKEGGVVRFWDGDNELFHEIGPETATSDGGKSYEMLESVFYKGNPPDYYYFEY